MQSESNSRPGGSSRVLPVTLPPTTTSEAAGGNTGAIVRRAARMARRIQQELAARTDPPAAAAVAVYERVFDAAPVGMALLDRDFSIVRVNEALTALLRSDATRFMGRNVCELSSAPHPARLALFAQKATTQDAAVTIEHRFSRGDGSEGWARTSLRRVAEGDVALVVAVEDVTSEQQALAEQRREAELDPLTGLLNRRGGDRRLRAALARMVDQGPVAVVVADADGFKEINDRFGHPAGDEVLKAIAGRMRATIRNGDDVARLGGDEFIVVAWVDGREEALAIAERCVATVAEPIRSSSGIPHQVTLSAGVAVAVPGGVADPDALLEAADRALYRAKAEGGNTCRLAGDP